MAILPTNPASTTYRHRGQGASRRRRQVAAGSARTTTALVAAAAAAAASVTGIVALPATVAATGRAGSPAPGTGMSSQVTVTSLKLARTAEAPAGAVSAQGLRRSVVAQFPIAKPADLVAVSADRPFAAGTRVSVRVREGKTWSAWTELEVGPEHAPDPGSVEAAGARAGTAPLLTNNATAIRVRVDTPAGKLPAGLRLDLVDAGEPAAGAVAGKGVAASGQVRAAEAVGMPTILSRAQWGADESWRRRAPNYTGNIKVGFVHHTATSSNYTPDRVPVLLRSIYAYHTKSLKHSDIDYNFLVDRFGRLWEGRYGGVDRPVEGGHTAGFNSNSFAVSALGDFESYNPPVAEMSAMSDAIARLFAWKLGLSGINPAAMVDVVSAGYIKKLKYARGVTAHIPAMSSHQTVNYTDCPGKFLQAQMPAIRALSASYSQLAISTPVPDLPTFQSGSRPSVVINSSANQLVSWRLDILSPCSDTPVRAIGGQTSGAGPISVTWDLADANGVGVPPGTYTLRMSGTSVAGTAVPQVSGLLTITPAPGGAWGPCANVTRYGADSAGTASVLVGTSSAPGAKTVVLTGDAAGSANALAAGVAAAPLARKLGAPLLVTAAEALPATVRADIVARAATEAIIVGGVDVVSDAVIADLAGAGIPATRLAGTTPAETAAVVATRFGPAASAVIAAPSSNPGQALAAAALAANSGQPVLLANPGELPVATQTALSGLGAATVTVAVGAELGDDVLAAGLAGRPYTRVSGGDARSGALAVANVYPALAASAWLMAETATTWGAVPALAATGSPLLFSAPGTLSGEPISYFTARPGLGAAATIAGPADLTDSQLGGVSRLLRGEPLSAPSTQPVPPPVVVTPTVSAPAVTATAARKLGRANATPEPRKRGASLTVRAKATAKFGDGSWRAAPDGEPVTLYFRAKGAKKWTKYATGTTAAGRAQVTTVAKKSGYWRVRLANKYSASDYVKVTK